MAAQLIDGRAIAAQLRQELKEEVAALAAQGHLPKLAVVLVGDDPASVVYSQAKERAAINVGMAFELFVKPSQTSEEEVLALIGRLNQDRDVHGIMVELPLPGHINKDHVMAAIDPLKDVDGVHPLNRGYLMGNEDGMVPATPRSCIELLERSGVAIAGKHAVIIGRGETVGKPLSFLLLKKNATITICHSRTPDLSVHTKAADIVVAAVGKPGLVTPEMVKPGAAVIDAGINQVGEDIVGDVDPAVAEVAGCLSPVPGGVGACTTVLLLGNVVKGLKIQKGLESG